MGKSAIATETGTAPGVVISLFVILSLLFSLAPACAAGSSQAGARADTLWIFDADFSDLAGDNAGWAAQDLSGTPGTPNYWHRDTLRPCPRPPDDPGEWSWWCGTYNPCWQQERGYGNDWHCCLERDFPLSDWTEEHGYPATLSFDQRYAMERDYDYGYVDISDDGGASWTTLATFDNPGFQGAGTPVDWTDPLGHQTLELSEYGESYIRLRFRFESDGAYSSQDQEDNPPQHSVRDGAWQIDNVVWTVGGVEVWSDDCESPGDNGWEHSDIPATGQTGVTFQRGQFGPDFWTNRPPYPDEPPTGTWMYAAVDPVTSRLVDDENAWLISPPISIGGAQVLVGEYSFWVDVPGESNDSWSLRVGAGDEPSCIQLYQFDPNPKPYGPEWVTFVDDWGIFAGPDWLRMGWVVWGGVPDPGHEHMGGLFLNRVRVGVPLGTAVPDDGLVRRMALKVYPNPFNPAATIEYSLRSRAHTTIRIIDLAGRVVRTLLDGPAGPGPGELFWDGTTDSGERAASGVYFVRLQSDGLEERTKAVLLK